MAQRNADHQEPAPAFSAWAKQEEQAESARGRLAREQFDLLREEAGQGGYLLVRNRHTDSYRLYVAERSVPHPTKVSELSYVRYVIELDVHRQRVKVSTRTSDRPPAVSLGKEWTLATAVRAYLAAIAKEKFHVPRLEWLDKKAVDQPDD